LGGRIALQDVWEISVSELDIPESWAKTTVLDAVYCRGRIGWKGLKASEYRREGPYFVSVREFTKDGKVSWADCTHISEDRYAESPEIALRLYDVLLCKDGSTIGKVAFVDHLPGPATVNSSIAVITPLAILVPRYLYFYFLSPFFRGLVNARIMGAAIPHIFQKDLRKLDIPVPPLAEQNRIVTKIESTFKKIEAIEKATETAESLLIKYRNSLLNKAFRGGLVPQDPKDEPASKLLKRIRVERAKAHTGKKKKDEMPPISEDEIPFEIPESWEWVRLGELVYLQNGYSFKQSEWSTYGLPIIRIQNLNRNGGGEFNYFKGIPEESWTVYSGDLLFAWSGSKGVSFGAHFWNGPKAVLNQHIFKVSAPNGVEKSYLYWLLRQFQTQIEDHAHGFKETFVHVKQSDLKLVVVPLPPLAEQSRIVKSIANGFDQVKVKEDSLRQILMTAKQLRMSISASAFSGKLVSQEASEGTGYDLLKKILVKSVPLQNAETNLQSHLETPKKRKLKK
jgi:type I restriction enzyme S subunit